MMRYLENDVATGRSADDGDLLHEVFDLVIADEVAELSVLLRLGELAHRLFVRSYLLI